MMPKFGRFHVRRKAVSPLHSLHHMASMFAVVRSLTGTMDQCPSGVARQLSVSPPCLSPQRDASRVRA
eukprot:15548816-Heterocapsa_arctica.AAC.1